MMSINERVQSLEKRVAQLTAKLAQLEKPRDWRNTIGMFANDSGMAEIFAEGQRIREADRKRAQRKVHKKLQRAKK
jgi:hypothetical protein